MAACRRPSPVLRRLRAYLAAACDRLDVLAGAAAAADPAADAHAHGGARRLAPTLQEAAFLRALRAVASRRRRAGNALNPARDSLAAATTTAAATAGPLPPSPLPPKRPRLAWMGP
jgi:hypothetical protein